jgi:thioester reductase-like protein
MTTFVTGGTGFLGGYALTELLRGSSERLYLLVRAKDDADAVGKIWHHLQLHMGRDELRSHLPRLRFVLGDLHREGLGLSPTVREELVAECDGVLHIAASLNRKSEKACLNTNLRGTLHLLAITREIVARGGLRRFTHVSTVAVCGERQDEVVTEDDIVDWDRSDYDPYARTKKFCEAMVRDAIPAEALCITRPSIVMGDSRFAETTQFDMVQAFCTLARSPVLPMQGEARLDIVNADFVGKALARLHLKPKLRWDAYHLSAGPRFANNAAEIGIANELNAGIRRARFFPKGAPAFGRWVDRLDRHLPRGNPGQQAAAVMKVFWPYITFDTVFDNQRVIDELGDEPVPFVKTCGPLFKWATERGFTYDHQPWSP